jgi:hypothetical protein
MSARLPLAAQYGLALHRSARAFEAASDDLRAARDAAKAAELDLEQARIRAVIAQSRIAEALAAAEGRAEVFRALVAAERDASAPHPMTAQERAGDAFESLG